MTTNTSIYNLSRWGTDGFRRKRIMDHVRQLQEDDKRLKVAEVLQDGNVNMELLANACTQRGLYVYAKLTRYSCAVSVTAAQMKQMLRVWLDHTLATPALPSLDLVLLPSCIPRLKSQELPLDTIVEEQEKQSIQEKASTVVNEVVEQEKRKEASQHM